ncbi:MAG: ribosome small subunit-dependent GTPase A [Oscillospiraceae bacterium]|nr:ribosome small subunit-dependent GTPase A [Oscillospiraceae bacterium]
MQGLIMDCLGGQYTVECDSELYICKARGVFRNKDITPCTGDRCEFSDGVITDILPRKNHIIRPPLANIDVMVFVVSTCEPSPNLLLLDKFIAVCEYMDITPVVALTKNDLATNEAIPDIYRSIGIDVIVSNREDRESIAPLISMIEGKICAFTGNTGVGKSTLLNFLSPDLELETAHISRKLGRGRHTTRVSRLYSLFGGYVADTPGFSSFDTDRYILIPQDKIQYCFREFDGYIGKCRFSDCSHCKEQGCAVSGAASEGAIPRSRYDSYLQMMDEARSRKLYK